MEEDDKQEVYRYRHEVHCYLDVLWLIAPNKSKARSTWYKWLSIQMNKELEDTHISKFTLEECKQALPILKSKYKQLTGKRNIPMSIKKQLHKNRYGKYDKELVKKINSLNSNEN